MCPFEVVFVAIPSPVAFEVLATMARPLPGMTMKMKHPTVTFRVRTLGCRVNHAESREIESLLLDRGMEPAEAGLPANLEVVHTCAVTHQAAAKSRHAIRRAALAKDGVTPHVLVTGCFVSADERTASDLAGGASIVGHRDEHHRPLVERVASQVDEWLGRRTTQALNIRSLATPINPSATKLQVADGIRPLPLLATPLQPGRHARAEIHIQDGCDAHCTFCIIPKLRPTLRSKSIDVVVEEARRLVDLGHREVVLSGIFLGAYGHETALRRKQARPQAEPLADLLDAVAQVPGLVRLRLSSLEPGDVTQPLLDAMVANQPVVVPHLHLPLQSGSNEILRMMNRQYTLDDYMEMIDLVKHELADDTGLPPALTTDIICGFPGESEQDFLQTVSVAEQVGFLHMHVFPFSPREGTAASRWTDRFVQAATIKARVRHLIALEEDPIDGLAIRWRRQLKERTLRVILEEADRDDPSIMTGRCDHYDRVHVPTSRPRGSVVRVRVTHVGPSRTAGQLVEMEQPLRVLSGMGVDA